MKRSTPLQRKTPLERFGRLRRRSAKTAKVYREERVPFVRRILDERPDCEACHLIRLRAPLFRCGGRSVDVHEVKTRGRGGDFLDEENVLAVCRQAHDWIEDNQQSALELGLLLHSWEPVPLAAERRAAVLEEVPW